MSISSTIGLWNVRNFKLEIGSCAPTCLKCTGLTEVDCSFCAVGLTLLGGECVCSNYNTYPSLKSTCATGVTYCYECKPCLDPNCLYC